MGISETGVRLDSLEREAITRAVACIHGEIYLFGSRTDPVARGGDIDLLVLTDAPAFETSQHVATAFFSHCEERIDVVVMDPAKLRPEQREFLAGLRLVRLQ